MPDPQVDLSSDIQRITAELDPGFPYLRRHDGLIDIIETLKQRDAEQATQIVANLDPALLAAGINARGTLGYSGVLGQIDGKVVHNDDRGLSADEKKDLFSVLAKADAAQLLPFFRAFSANREDALGLAKAIAERDDKAAPENKLAFIKGIVSNAAYLGEGAHQVATDEANQVRIVESTTADAAISIVLGGLKNDPQAYDKAELYLKKEKAIGTVLEAASGMIVEFTMEGNKAHPALIAKNSPAALSAILEGAAHSSNKGVKCDVLGRVTNLLERIYQAYPSSIVIKKDVNRVREGLSTLQHQLADTGTVCKAPSLEAPKPPASKTLRPGSI